MHANKKNSSLHLLKLIMLFLWIWIYMNALHINFRWISSCIYFEILFGNSIACRLFSIVFYKYTVESFINCCSAHLIIFFKKNSTSWKHTNWIALTITVKKKFKILKTLSTLVHIGQCIRVAIIPIQKWIVL